MKKETHSVCCQARNSYYDFVANEQTIPADIHRHIQDCPVCRQEVRRLQQELAAPPAPPASAAMDILRAQMPLFDQWVACLPVRPFLVLYCASDRPAVPTPVAAHLAHCPACRQDLKTLAELALSPAQQVLAGRYLADDLSVRPQIDPICLDALEAIRQRPSSDILTKIRRDEATGEYEISAAAERPARASAPVRWVRRGLAAAVLLVAALLVWQAAPARGLDLKEIYQALGSALNVAIASYQPQPGENLIITSYGLEDSRPIQQIWISSTLGVQLYIEKDRAILWDLQRQQKIIRTAEGRQILPITQPVQKLETPWGLLPFRNLSELPPRYRWQNVQTPEVAKDPNLMVYDLTWTDVSAGGRTIQRRWRGYLDAQTKLPVRIEWWDKLPGEDFRKMTTTLITYPPQDQVLARIAAEGFDYLPADQK